MVVSTSSKPSWPLPRCCALWVSIQRVCASQAACFVVPRARPIAVHEARPPPGIAHRQLAAVAGLAGDDVAQRQQLQDVVGRQAVEHLARPQLLVAGHRRAQRVPALDLRGTGHGPRVAPFRRRQGTLTSGGPDAAARTPRSVRSASVRTRSRPGGFVGDSPGWVADAIWWHVYPLGFTGAEPTATPGDAGPAPAAAAGGLAGLRRRAGLQRARARPGLRLRDPRLRHRRPLPRSIPGSATTTTSTRLVDGRPRPRAAGAARRRVQPRRPGVPGVPRGARAGAGRARGRAGSASTRRARRPDGFGYATSRATTALVALNHDEPAVARPRRRRHEPLAATAASTAGGSTPPTPCRRAFWRERAARVRARASGRLVRRRGDPRRLRRRTCASAGSTRSPSTSCGRRSGARSTTATSSSSPGRAGPARRAARTRSCRMTFVGNHDVTRLASRLADQRHLAHALAVLFTVARRAEPSTTATSRRSAGSRRSAPVATTRSARRSPTAPDELSAPAGRRLPAAPGADRAAPPAPLAARAPARTPCT